MTDDHIREFKTWDELQAFMAENERKANERVTPEQRAIQPGAYVVRPIEVGRVPTLIVGKTYSHDEFIASERAAGADEEELDYAGETFEDRVERGLLFGRWYSILERAGEYGDAHISTLLPVGEKDFHDYLHLIQDGQEPISLWAMRTYLQGDSNGTADDPGPEDS